MPRWVIQVQETPREFTWEEDRLRVDALLQRMGLRLEEYIVIRNGEVLTEKDWVSSTDTVELVRVISGG